MKTPTHILTFRPLVRYVDKKQAVIDAHFMFHPIDHPTTAGKKRHAKYRHPICLDAQIPSLEVVLRMVGPQGKIYDYRASIDPSQPESMIRFDIPQPKRWWPSTLGKQSLYQLTAVLIQKDNLIDTWQASLGLTSVRAQTANWIKQGLLLVNGKKFCIHEVYPFTKSVSNEILPFTADMLVHIKKHFAPDNLYHAADKAGVLLLQSVAVNQKSAQGKMLSPKSRQQITQQIDRLSSHPSIVGWHIPSKFKNAEQIAKLIHQLDPVRRIFKHLPRVC